MKHLLIEMSHIDVVRGKKILDDISIKINTGEDVAIMGPNGSGKSSIIKLITRAYYPVMKENFIFRINGKESWDVFELRKTLGLVSNELGYEFMRPVTVEDAVLSGFYSAIGIYQEEITGAMWRAAEKAMAFMGVTEIRERKMDTLSSGEAQRVLIARAIAHGPKALVLDEPSNNLDFVSAARFRQMLRKVAKKTSIIIATHDLKDIVPEVKRVILLKAGKVFKDGAKESVLTSGNLSEVFEEKITIERDKNLYWIKS